MAKNTFQDNIRQRQPVLKGPCEPAPGVQVALWGRGPGGVLPACRVPPAQLSVTAGSLNFCAACFRAPCGPWPTSWRIAAQRMSHCRVGSAVWGACSGQEMPEARFHSGAGRSGACPQPLGLCRENLSTLGVGRTPLVARGRGLWFFRGRWEKSPVCFAWICKGIKPFLSWGLGSDCSLHFWKSLLLRHLPGVSLYTQAKDVSAGGWALGGGDRV